MAKREEGLESPSPRRPSTQQRAETAAPDHAQVAFHPPLLLLLAVAIGFVLRWVAPSPFLPRGLSLYLGTALSAASFALFFWAVYTMIRGHASIPTTEPTDAIVVRGPYRFSRNPIYLAMLLLQVGIAIWANSPWFLLLAAISAVLLWWGVILREERYLEGKFGSEYLSYKSRVRRSRRPPDTRVDERFMRVARHTQRRYNLAHPPLAAEGLHTHVPVHRA